MKDSISFVIQTARNFCLVDAANGPWIYTYEGKLVSNLKLPGIKFEGLNKRRVSLSTDLLGLVDLSNPKIIRLYDISSGKQLNHFIEHSNEIMEVDLNKTDLGSERKLAFIDSNRDLFMTPAHKKDCIKLSAVTDSFLWHEKFDILSAIADLKLLIWYYPNAIYVDRDLMDKCKYTKDTAEVGKGCTIQSFANSQLSVRKQDGCNIALLATPYANLLFDYCEKGKWDLAIKLCRFVKEQTFWACLAANALYQREIDTAEISLAAIESVDKVQYINTLRNLPSDASRNAGLLIYFRKYSKLLCVI